MRRSQFCKVLATVVFGLAASPAWAAIQLDLVVNTGGANPELQVISNTSKCAGGDEACIEVLKYSAPNIRFNLEDACDPGGPSYQLNQIEIAMVEKQFGIDTLPATVAADFNADATTGVIDLSAGKNKLDPDRIKFKNKNSAAYTVFYRIQAIDCAVPPVLAPIYLDPRIRNTGK